VILSVKFWGVLFLDGAIRELIEKKVKKEKY